MLSNNRLICDGCGDPINITQNFCQRPVAYGDPTKDEDMEHFHNLRAPMNCWEKRPWKEFEFPHYAPV